MRYVQAAANATAATTTIATTQVEGIKMKISRNIYTFVKLNRQ